MSHLLRLCARVCVLLLLLAGLAVATPATASPGGGKPTSGISARKNHHQHRHGHHRKHHHRKHHHRHAHHHRKHHHRHAHHHRRHHHRHAHHHRKHHHRHAHHHRKHHHRHAHHHRKHHHRHAHHHRKHHHRHAHHHRKHHHRLARATRVLRIAASKRGTPYRWGATGPRAFDCSGFTRWVFARVGKHLPRTAAEQAAATRHIRPRAAHKADLVFFASGGHVYHVGIYAGHGTIWHAPHTGAVVRRERIWTRARFFGRVL